VNQEANRRMGDYEILGELGSGGMGRVYRVKNVLSDRIEAMKVLLPDLVGRQELAARFVREIKVLASLDHPNIAQLRTAITVDNQLVMIMELVEGSSLAERVERGPIAVGDALNYIDQALNALSYAHQRGVIHRDIKPANMMLTPQGVVKLMDFGIARSSDGGGLTMTGTTLGSLSYMSPEQTTGQGVDARSDLYSVGVSLYEMVTGQLPFQGESDFAIMTAQVKETPRPPIELQPQLPAAFNEIILMAMAKDPAYRFQTADAFRAALKNVRAGTPVPNRGGTMLETPKPATFNSAATATATPASPVRHIAIPGAQATPRPSGSMGTVLDAKVTPRPSSTGTILDARVTPATPTPMPPPPQQQASGNRGLYMALGAVVAVAALALAAYYLPRHGDTAKATTNPPSTNTADISTAPVSAAKPITPTATPTPHAPSAAMLAAQQAQAKAAMKVSAQTRIVASAGKPPAPSAGQGPDASQGQPPAPPPPSAAQMDELEHEIDQLNARAAAVNNSLDIMQEQQHQQGVGMRGDIVMHQSSMKTNLRKAQDALQQGDAARAQRYADMTQTDLAALEHFLGR
jgi:serine/threonine-protein kinase